MSALEETLATTETVDGGTPASAPEVVAEAVVASPAAAPAAKESRLDTLKRAFNTPPNSKVREANGKFAPIAPAAEVAATPPAPSRPAMPKSFSMDLEQHWNAAPIELLSKFVQRETETENGIKPLKERARFAEEIENEFKPYDDMIKGEGGSRAGAVRELLQTAAALRSPDAGLRARVIAGLMQQFKVPQEHIQQVLSGQAPTPQHAAFDPQQVSQLVQKQLTAFQQQQTESRNQEEINQFAAKPEHKHFDAVSDDMAALMQSARFQSENAGKSNAERLQAAYEEACYARKDIRTLVLAEQQATARTQNQVTQARKAAVQVTGAPAAAPALKINPKDRRATLSNLFHASR